MNDPNASIIKLDSKSFQVRLLSGIRIYAKDVASCHFVTVHKGGKCEAQATTMISIDTTFE